MCHRLRHTKEKTFLLLTTQSFLISFQFMRDKIVAADTISLALFSVVAHFGSFVLYIFGFRCLCFDMYQPRDCRVTLAQSACLHLGRFTNSFALLILLRMKSEILPSAKKMKSCSQIFRPTSFYRASSLARTWRKNKENQILVENKSNRIVKKIKSNRIAKE